MRTEAFIGLGSNVGDRLGLLAAALVAIDAEAGVRVLRVSHAYESTPWGVTDQPLFANAVALVAFDGEADSLLTIMTRIEASLGRVRGESDGPRTIDLDLLLFGDEEWDSSSLVLPHPRLLERDFVVTPLLEIAPGAALPDGRPVDPGVAVEGRILGVLGAVPGYEDVTGPPDEPEPEDAGPEPTEAEAVGEWVAVGPRRYERNAPNTSTDFELLFYENVLKQAGIPCRYYPHRPNEGFATFPGLAQTVRLMVPASRAREAQELIDRVAAAPLEPPD